ncbi:pre-mRNA splicing factor syf2 [Beauveria brongniartii RCEF 3172]|uniref:Pre-mRNA-splicing factor SYF2 n=1 Tax=Beauveria brongniartii RCEF 3172 TaxID=1081107 RepID=A0A162KEK0_9HYPO|nr:pre-mRNA splicing factor syf2 [Beauveria brongniartii RCEF 3172]
MSPPTNKRRTRADAAGEAAVDTITEQPSEKVPSPVSKKAKETPSAADDASKAKDRLARFKALQARAKSSSQTNMKEVTRESQRLAEDPSQLTALRRRHDIAAHKLLKAETEDAGEDFERKRAWDWTVDESERWDKRLKKKAAHRDNNAFQDYQAESSKVYKRQLRNLDVDLNAYTKQKLAAIEKAAAAGSLEIVETEDGEMIAVDKDGTFYATADSTSFAQNKPDKAAIDRLVADIERAEAQSLKKRRDRQAKNGDDGDITYINEKNKQFNQKLARFYDKYTSDIRDSFERGTMI